MNVETKPNSTKCFDIVFRFQELKSGCANLTDGTKDEYAKCNKVIRVTGLGYYKHKKKSPHPFRQCHQCPPLIRNKREKKSVSSSSFISKSQF